MSKTLQQWLDWQESFHHSEIELGLERVRKVFQALLNSPSEGESIDATELPFTVITVAGTNGKGSTVAFLEAILSAAGYQVGSYTSPHLVHYNERIKINLEPVSDQDLCQAFERIDRARGSTSLTYFEFGTLAAIDLFLIKQCEIVVLEVGLGGRLDAVNIVEPDVALVTTVDLDHQEWLGKDRNSIALEKAGIYRQNKPAVYGDTHLPDSIQKKISLEKLEFYQFSQDYRVALRSQKSIEQQPIKQWDWIATKNKPFKTRFNLPVPGLRGGIQLKNAANAILVLELVKNTHPVSQSEIKKGLMNASIIGRFQRISTVPFVILDVAHNVQAAQNLRQSVEQLCFPGKVNVIIGFLKDKDVKNILSVFNSLIDIWRIIELDSSRAMPAGEIAQLLREQSISEKKIKQFSGFEQAYRDFSDYNVRAGKIGNTEEMLLVFGSFVTVSNALIFFGQQK